VTMGLRLPGRLQSLFAMEARKFLLVGPGFLPHEKATHAKSRMWLSRMSLSPLCSKISLS
jgi:hypothetical protein